MSRRGRKEAAVPPRPFGSRERTLRGLQTLPPALSGWRSHLRSSPELLLGNGKPAWPIPRPGGAGRSAQAPSCSPRPPECPVEGLAASGRVGADRRWNWQRGMTAEEAVCSPSAGVEKLCFSEPSSVLTAAADAATATDGERGRGKPVPSWPAPSEPGLLPRSPARPLPRASVWRSHSALTTRLAGSGSRKSQPRRAVRLLRAPLPRQAGLFGFFPAGVSGTGGSRPALFAELCSGCTRAWRSLGHRAPW